MDQTLPEDEPRGARLGLPAEGPGSVSSSGRRALAFAVDALGSGLVARLVDPVDATGTLDLSVSTLPLAILAVLYLVGLLLGGQTPGMRLCGIRVARVDGARLGLVPAGLRTALLLLLVPAVITDRDGRGLHDRAGGTVVLNTRATARRTAGRRNLSAPDFPPSEGAQDE